MVCYKVHVQVGPNMESVKDGPHMTLVYGDSSNHPKEKLFKPFINHCICIYTMYTLTPDNVFRANSEIHWKAYLLVFLQWLAKYGVYRVKMLSVVQYK